MGPLDISDQLSYIAIECDILLILQLFEYFHKATNQVLEDSRNHLTLGTSRKSTAEIGRITALAACSVIGSQRFKC